MFVRNLPGSSGFAERVGVLERRLTGRGCGSGGDEEGDGGNHALGVHFEGYLMD